VSPTPPSRRVVVTAILLAAMALCFYVVFMLSRF
jgi:hypothetical protein